MRWPWRRKFRARIEDTIAYVIKNGESDGIGAHLREYRDPLQPPIAATAKLAALMFMQCSLDGAGVLKLFLDSNRSVYVLGTEDFELEPAPGPSHWDLVRQIFRASRLHNG